MTSRRLRTHRFCAPLTSSMASIKVKTLDAPEVLPTNFPRFCPTPFSRTRLGRLTVTDLISHSSVLCATRSLPNPPSHRLFIMHSRMSSTSPTPSHRQQCAYFKVLCFCTADKVFCTKRQPAFLGKQ